MKHTNLRIGDLAEAPAGLANAILRCNSVPEMRTLAPLPIDAQRLIDSAVTRVGRERLVIANDILAEGLVFNLPDPLSVMHVDWQKLGESGFAQRVMLPDARGERQMPGMGIDSVPIYITMDDFSFNVRVLRASQRAGLPLDTTMVEQSTRNVNEAIEDAIINGAGIQVNGMTAPGLLSSGANINTHAYASNEAWDAAGKTGEEILADVLAMIEILQNDRYYGPYNLYVPASYGLKLVQDYKSATSGTIIERLTSTSLGLGGRPLRIRVADQLPANRTVLVQMTSNVLDMIVGQTPIEVNWEGPGGWRFNAVVMAIMVHRIKSDSAGRSGIVAGNTT